MWYYKEGQSEVGPVNIDELKALVKEKKINGRTLIRDAKGASWKPLAERVKRKPKAQKTETIAANNLQEEKEIIPPAPTPKQQLEQQAIHKNREKSPEIAEKESPAQPPALPRKIPFVFTGDGTEYFKIWIVNIVLSIVTLGIYSAWAKVRRKQYFYGNTKVDNASFSYLASPITILKGRIIVFIAFVFYSAINQFYPLAGTVLLLCMLPLLPWFIVRALAFNARNSATRNIRFSFRGTYWEATKVYLLLPILVPFTLGFLFPYIYYRQKQFLVENSGYGTTSFRFHASSGDYYRIFLSLLLPFIIAIVAGVIGDYFFSFASILFSIVFYLYALAYIAVRSTNLLYNSTQLSKHGFESTMVIKEYLGIVFTNTLATVLTVGLFYPYAQVRAYRYQIEHLSLLAAGDLDQFAADEKGQLSALGDEAAEFMDFDFGL